MGLILVMGLLDMIGVASILPFLRVLSNPQVIETTPTLSYIYNRLGFKNTTDFMFFLGFLTLAFLLVSQLFKAATFYSLTRFCKMRGYSIGSRVLAGYLFHPYSWFIQRNSADLGKTILSEVDKSIDNIIIPALRMIAYGAIIVSVLALLIFVDPVAAILGASVLGGAYAAIFAGTRRYLSKIGVERLLANEERFRVVQEAFSGVKDVKLLGLERAYVRRFRAPAARFARHDASATILGEMPRYLLELIVFGAMVIFLLALLVAADGQIDEVVPVVGLYALAGMRIMPALQNFYGCLSKLRFYRPALDSLNADIREIETLPAPPPFTGEPLRPRQEIAFVDVRYTYPGVTRPSLVDLNLVIEANTTVGLVGSTGAGKTTAVDILIGLLEPDGGTVRVDGVPIDAFNRQAWQHALGYVPQQIFLTDDTVAANIALGVPSAEIDMTAVERAARVAELHHFVMDEMPAGYDTKVGERGVRLSGGQRQRIGIARALYHDPAVLVLDEATSALDNRTERAVMDAVHNLAHAKTLIMIAHRLSTVEECDQIFMLEHGRCVAAGSYENLLQRNASFRDLAQAAGQ